MLTDDEIRVEAEQLAERLDPGGYPDGTLAAITNVMLGLVRDDRPLLYAAQFPRVMAAVTAEMAFQRLCHPRTAPRSLTSIVALCEQELLECRAEACRGASNRGDALRELVQVAAMALTGLMENGVEERRLSECMIKLHVSDPDLVTKMLKEQVGLLEGGAL